MYGLRVGGKTLPVIYADRADAERDGRRLALDGFQPVEIIDQDTGRVVMRIGTDATPGDEPQRPDRLI